LFQVKHNLLTVQIPDIIPFFKSISKHIFSTEILDMLGNSGGMAILD